MKIGHPRRERGAIERQPATFESLPSEIHMEILEEMSSTKDLHAMIHASPVAYNAFLLAHEIIFTTVLENSVHPSVFRDMLAIMNAPKFEEFECKLG